MKTTEGKVVWCEGDEESGHGLREGRGTAERPQWRSRSSSRHRIIEPATDLPIIYRTIPCVSILDIGLTNGNGCSSQDIEEAERAKQTERAKAIDAVVLSTTSFHESHMY
ncbi:unnamed protein product [Clonostachys byssicola]|uniref:Uncharacterized protein n=1 Tax=Clonostachys byssicola TaxID=160290 RepID=A0A9N9Y7T7_9HYPO|nr:unnamed protein product [Clonostachys byssicola]